MKAIQVHCPVCGARPGERCTPPNAQVKKYTHRERVKKIDRQNPGRRR